MEEEQQITLTNEQYKELCDIYQKLVGVPLLDIHFNNNFNAAFNILCDRLDERAAAARVREEEYFKNLLELTSTSAWKYRV